MVSFPESDCKAGKVRERKREMERGVTEQKSRIQRLNSRGVEYLNAFNANGLDDLYNF